ncbi:MAG: N-acetylmuramoyl-L-alanine amidase [Deltaproteobacteria bacterium]|nr:N-acetylmuramoyl-L-alanine amidase [Deltaproteobacteria bacterium]
MASRLIERIILHCSATPNGRPHTVQDIDAWHRANGYKRTHLPINPSLSSIGYHYVVYVDGSVHTGRGVEEVGAHAHGHNQNSIGICMIGTDKFTRSQWMAVSELVHVLTKAYPAAEVLGHRDLPDVKKVCPGFNAITWFYSGMGQLEGHCLTG